MSEFENKVKDILFQALNSKWTYPQVFDALKTAGVAGYETDVSNFKIRYFGTQENFVETGPTDFKVPVGQKFNKEELLSARHRVQSQKTDYPTFLKEIAAAGVPKYRVNMSERTVSYLGKNEGEEYVESVPVPKPA